MKELLISAIEKSQQEAAEPSLKKFALAVVLENPSAANVDLIKGQIAPLLQDSQIFYDEGVSLHVISLYDTDQELRADQSLLNNIQDNYNDELIEELQGDNWLKDYLDYRDMGIQIVMDVNTIHKQDDIPKYLEKEKARIENHSSHMSLQKLCANKANSYTHQDIANDFMSYASTALDPTSYQPERLEYAIKQAFVEMDSLLENVNLYFDRCTFQSEFRALNMRGKGRYLDIHREMDRLRRTFEPDDMEKFSNVIAQHIIKSAPELEIKQIYNKADYDFIPFGGNDLGKDLNFRLSSKNMTVLMDDLGHSLYSALSDSLATYYLEILSNKHALAFKEALHQYSISISPATIAEDIARLAVATNPLNRLDMADLNINTQKRSRQKL